MSAFDTASSTVRPVPYPVPYPVHQNDPDDILGLYKVATGEDISKAEKPGMFDLKGKAKKTAWQAKVDEGLTSDEAKEKYVALVESLKEKLGYDADKVPEAVGA
ncbi:Acyl-CoA-binding protein-like protein [Lachnellula subtilissima]|uniref:Acyl-CoA-binding protein-like protein n=1 Tax=Lachnellula subtilissima TaxID=602034 RepID=A0A8H8RJL4_9HELO|nr:Acyl-CoA-binding protein-like protein [Lachnellula subtilissima]